jgi:membrane-associated protease RseP (regulator of RpoE activity)
MATPAMLHEDRRGATAPSRPAQPARPWIQAVLLILTLFSTTMVGMRYMVNFQQGKFPLSSDADIFPFRWVCANMSHFALGLPFSLTLLGILLTHEFGHYFACRAYGIRVSMPYLIPAPSLSGTAGAVIRLQSRVKSRKALLSIGAIGPIAGFLVAMVMACIGFRLSRIVAVEPQKLVNFQSPLLFQLLHHLLGHRFHLSFDAPLLWHPVLVASWIGVLITSLNLLPAGQLDGGHVLYSLSPRIHRKTTYAVMAGLVYLGVFHWLGWLFWAGLLCLPGMRHPAVRDTDPLPGKLVLLAPVALLILVLTATPEPFTRSSLLEIIAHIRH